MANGDDHAKQTIMIQANRIIRRLSNGSKEDPKTHGEALLLLWQVVEPIFGAKLVTVDQLEDRLREYRDDCPVRAAHDRLGKAPGHSTSVSFGPLRWQGELSKFGIVVVVALFLIGKGKGWW